MSKVKGVTTIQVVNYDRNGKVIKDLSKVKVPIEQQKKILDTLNKGKVIVNNKGGNK